MSAPKPTSMAIRWVHPRRCLVKAPLQHGEVRRTPNAHEKPTSCVGYDVACPACRARSIWLSRDISESADAARFIEGAPVRVTEDQPDAQVVLPGRGLVSVAYWRPSTLSVEGSRRCRGCGMTVTISAGTIAAA